MDSLPKNSSAIGSSDLAATDQFHPDREKIGQRSGNGHGINIYRSARYQIFLVFAQLHKVYYAVSCDRAKISRSGPNRFEAAHCLKLQAMAPINRPVTSHHTHNFEACL
jgi:hypothetical protein